MLPCQWLHTQSHNWICFCSIPSICFILCSSSQTLLGTPSLRGSGTKEAQWPAHTWWCHQLFLVSEQIDTACSVEIMSWKQKSITGVMGNSVELLFKQCYSPLKGFAWLKQNSYWWSLHPRQWTQHWLQHYNYHFVFKPLENTVPLF